MSGLKRILAVGKIRRAVINSHSTLEDSGYSVAYAADADTACELMASLKFDLVVLSHEQQRSPAMMMEIKRRNPKSVVALIHPYPDEHSPIVHLAPKTANLRTNDLVSELRFLFDSAAGASPRKATGPSSS